MTIREMVESNEGVLLSSWSKKSKDTLGRKIPEPVCPIRTEFQRDRDRILHSKSFRRLKRKTQVFLAPNNDHYRTRMTHTLEVSQIARTIGRCKQLNEDLIEAISLGHDLGHTPYGHAGEAVLHNLLPEGFHHNVQSVRVVEVLEKEYGLGLNLTQEVIDGILNHKTGHPTLTNEAKVVQFSDKIAYLNHDIEDAISAGILKNQDLPKDILHHLGENKSQRITKMITSIVHHSHHEIEMEEETYHYFHKLRKFLFSNVYNHPKKRQEEGKVKMILEYLFHHFSTHPQQLPPFYRHIAEVESVQQGVADYLCGMSDDFATSTFQELCLPKTIML